MSTTGTLSGATSGSGTSIAQTLTGNGVATYSVIPTLNGCSGSAITVPVTVNPLPVYSGIDPVQICSGANVNYSLPSTPSGANFTWTVVDVQGVSGASDGAGTTINDLLDGDGYVTYELTPTLAGCTGPIDSVTVRVTPLALAIADPNPQTICAGQLTNISITSLPPGASFTWTVISNTGVTGFTPSGSGNTINDQLFGSGVIQYQITPTLNGCVGYDAVVDVTVNPTATITATPDPAPVCSGTAANISLSTNPAGAALSWTPINVPGTVSGAVAGSGTFIPDVLTGSGVFSYEITADLAGCQSKDTVEVTVNPTPVYTGSKALTICTNTAANFSLISDLGNSFFVWSPVSNTGVTGDNPGAGTEPAAIINDVLVGDGTVGYEIIPQFGGCIGKKDTVYVTVTPAPVVTATPNLQTICTGTSTNIVLTSVPSGATYAWTSTVISGAVTGNSAAGTGSPIAETLTGAGIVEYTITPTLACPGAPVSVQVTVNPTPVVTATPASQSICTGTATNIVLGITPGTATFSWTSSVLSGTVTGNGTGTASPIAETLTGNGIVEYTITPMLGLCPGTPVKVQVTVNPLPVATATPATQTICSGTPTNIGLSSSPAGATFNWTLATLSGAVTGNTSGSGSTIAEVLNGNGIAEYTITPMLASCAGTPIKVPVIVNPIAIIAANPDPATICSGSPANINLTTAPASASLTWVPVGVPATITGATAGTGAGTGAIITDLLTGSGSFSYEITADLAGCPSNYTLNVTVTPPPVYTGDTALTICSNNPVNLTLTSAPANVFFVWSPVSSTGVTGANPGSGTGATAVITDVLAGDGVVAYELIPQVGGCIGIKDTVYVTVTPTPVVTANPANSTICTGAQTGISVNATAGTNVTWTSIVVSGTVTGNTASGSGTSIAETLSGDGVVAYIINGTLGTCLADDDTAFVTVTPAPVISFSSDTVVCSGSTTAVSLSSVPAGASFSWMPYDIQGAIIGVGSGPSVGTTISDQLEGWGVVYYQVTADIGGGCQSMDTVVIRVDSLPVYVGNHNYTICGREPLSIPLISSPAGAAFNWTVTADPTVIGAAPGSGVVLNPTLDGEGKVSYFITATRGACTGPQDSIIVVVKPIPSDGSISGADAICDFTKTYNYQLNPVITGNNLSIQWSASGGVVNSGNNSSVANITWNDPPSSVNVIITNTVSLCSYTKTLSVGKGISEDPAFSYPNFGYLCTGDGIALATYSSAGVFSCDDPNLILNASNGTINLTLSKVSNVPYKIKHKVGTGACSDSTIVSVTIFKSPGKPELLTTSDTVVCDFSKNYTYIFKVTHTDEILLRQQYIRGGKVVAAIQPNPTFTDPVTFDTITVKWSNNPDSLIHNISYQAAGLICLSPVAYQQIYTDTLYSRFHYVTTEELNEPDVLLNFRLFATNPKDSGTVYRRTATPVLGAWEPLLNIKQGDTSFVDLSPVPGTSQSTFDYKIAGNDQCGNLRESFPSRTILLGGVVDNNVLTTSLSWSPYLDWTYLGGVSEYQLYHKQDDETDFTLLATINTLNDLTYIHRNVTTGAKHCYRIKAVSLADGTNNNAVYTSWSNSICVTYAREIHIYNSFSPNGDSKNEFFYIDNINLYPDSEVYVLNRWGERVFHKKGYNNDWDGAGLPEGTYFYIVKANGKEYKGSILLAR